MFTHKRRDCQDKPKFYEYENLKPDFLILHSIEYVDGSLNY